MGKHHSAFAYGHTDVDSFIVSESNTICFVEWIDTGCFAVGDVCISRCHSISHCFATFNAQAVEFTRLWARCGKETQAVNLIVRDAIESDLPAIVEIYNATVPTRMVTAELEPTTVEARLPWFREHSPEQYPFWVAESEGRVIGWLDFKKFLPRSAYRGTAEISVYVDEEFRRRRVAQRLLEHAIGRAPSLGTTALIGLVFGHNEPSLKLFDRFGFERWAFLPGVAQLDGMERDLIVMGRHCPARSTAGAKSLVQSQTNKQVSDSLSLMHTLMQYRHESIHSQLLKIRDKYSMLHLDVLILIYHFAKIGSGDILEIGAFVGGATIAAAFGVRDSGRNKKLITIETGGSVKHKRLGTRNILRDLERNLARQRVPEM